MKVKVYDEVNKPVEKEITLRLFRSLGKVVVGIVDDKGSLVNCGVLIEFNSDMTFKRMLHVSTELGLPLDEARRLVEVIDN